VTASPELAADAVTLAAELSARHDAVYAWLVDELGFPYDWATVEKPPWLSVGKLAEVWGERSRDDEAWVARDSDPVEDHRLAILEETGWTGDA
jgi:hypothetical protein